MIVEVDVADYREVVADGVIMQVRSDNGRYPYSGPEYNEFCRRRGLSPLEKLAQDKRLYDGFSLDGGRNASVIEVEPSSHDFTTRLVCGYMSSLRYVAGGAVSGGPGGLLYNGLLAASAADLRFVAMTYPDGVSSTYMGEIAAGMRDTIKAHRDDPDNRVQRVLIAVPYNTSLANWLHLELDC